MEEMIPSLILVKRSWREVGISQLFQKSPSLLLASLKPCWILTTHLFARETSNGKITPCLVASAARRCKIFLLIKRKKSGLRLSVRCVCERKMEVHALILAGLMLFCLALNQWNADAPGTHLKQETLIAVAPLPPQSSAIQWGKRRPLP